MRTSSSPMPQCRAAPGRPAEGRPQRRSPPCARLRRTGREIFERRAGPYQVVRTISPATDTDTDPTNASRRWPGDFAPGTHPGRRREPIQAVTIGSRTPGPSPGDGLRGLRSPPPPAPRSARCSARRPCAGCPRTRTARGRSGRPAPGGPGPPRSGRCRRRRREWGTPRPPGRRTATTPGAVARISRALPTVTSPSKRACTVRECVVTTGTRTQVTATGSAGRPRILRDSSRTFISSEDQPSSRSDPAHGTTFRATGSGNGPVSSPTARRTSPGLLPSSVPATRDSCRRRVSTPARPGAARPPGTRTTTSSRSPNSACSAPSATIMDRVVQFGLAMIPRGRIRAALRRSPRAPPGARPGPSGRRRSCPRRPRPWRRRSAPTARPPRRDVEHRDVDPVEGVLGQGRRTSTSSPRTASLRPAERGGGDQADLAPDVRALGQDLEHDRADGSGRPTTASVGPRRVLIVRCLRRRRPRRCRSRGRRRVCTARTASLTSSARVTTEIRISEVEISSMLTPASDSASKKPAVTPGLRLHARADQRDLADLVVVAQRVEADARPWPSPGRRWPCGPRSWGG